MVSSHVADRNSKRRPHARGFAQLVHARSGFLGRRISLNRASPGSEIQSLTGGITECSSRSVAPSSAREALRPLHQSHTLPRRRVDRAQDGIRQIRRILRSSRASPSRPRAVSVVQDARRDRIPSAARETCCTRGSAS